MRKAFTGQFFSRAVLLAAGLGAGVPAIAQAQGAPVPESHTVKKGDTLWDLAKAYFGDPTTWPQIYKLNTSVVEDPHWIYPGEVLRLTGAGAAVIPAEPAPPAGLAVVEPAAPAAQPPVAAAPVAVAGPPAPEVAPAVAEPAPEGMPAGQGGAVRSAGPIPGNPTALFGRTDDQSRMQNELVAFRERSYSPLRAGEFYSAGFMTEGKSLPYGEVLGDVVPPQIGTIEPTTYARQFKRIGVKPPKGATYQVGDSLLLANRRQTEGAYGDVIVPTGIARVIDVTSAEVIALVLQQFDRIVIGQVTLPLERFTPAGNARAVPVSDGITAEVVAKRSETVLAEPQTVVYLDKGRADGVAPGDVFDLWSTPEERWDAATTVAQPIAKVQIVRVGEHTSSGLLVNIISADITPGTRARQVARLPN